MRDYSDIGLTPNLQSVTSLSALRKGRFMTSTNFDIDTDRATITRGKIGDLAVENANMGTAVIGTANIGTLSFNEISGGTATLGGTLNGDGVLIVNNEQGVQRISLDRDDLQLNYGAKIGWGTPGEESDVIINAQGGIGGTVNLEHNAISWNHYIESARYLINCVDGTIEFNINDFSEVSLIRIKSGSGTIAELDTSGNLNIAGELGTGVSF